jgi:hypothetical protein
MPQLGQAEARDQGQQCAVGHRARVVGRLGLAAERKGDRLRTRRSRQVIHRIPGGGEGAPQQQRKGNANREIRA